MKTLFTLLLALESAVTYDGQNRRGSSRAPVILMLSWSEEIQTGVERERLASGEGGGRRAASRARYLEALMVLFSVQESRKYSLESSHIRHLK